FVFLGASFSASSNFTAASSNWPDCHEAQPSWASALDFPESAAEAGALEATCAGALRPKRRQETVPNMAMPPKGLTIRGRRERRRWALLSERGKSSCARRMASSNRACSFGELDCCSGVCFVKSLPRMERAPSNALDQPGRFAGRGWIGFDRVQNAAADAL